MVSAKIKSEEKDIKLSVFYRKDDFPSLFRGKLANFVRVIIIIRYNLVKIESILKNRHYVILKD